MCVFITIFKMFANMARHNRGKSNQHFLSESQQAPQKREQNKQKMFIWMPRSPVECTMQYEVNGLPQLTWHRDFYCQKEINVHHAQIVWSLFVWRSRGSLWLCSTRCVAFPRMLKETWHRNRICSPLGASTILQTDLRATDCKWTTLLSHPRTLCWLIRSVYSC